MKELILTNFSGRLTRLFPIKKKYIYTYFKMFCFDSTIMHSNPRGLFHFHFIFPLRSSSSSAFFICLELRVRCCIRKTRKIAFLIYSSGAFHEVGLQSFFYFFLLQLCVCTAYFFRHKEFLLFCRGISVLKSIWRIKVWFPGPDASLKILQIPS